MVKKDEEGADEPPVTPGGGPPLPVTPGGGPPLEEELLDGPV